MVARGVKESTVRFLVSGSTRTLRGLLPRYGQYLGFLLTPANRNAPATVDSFGVPWGADNGAFSGFDPESFRRMVARIRHCRNLQWVVAPDAVGDSRTTLLLWAEWELQLRAAGVPVAFVLQDGQERYELPDADCYFVGGSTVFKLSAAARDLVLEGKCRGAHVHMGRVNSLRRLLLAQDWGCDSVDGSAASKWGDVRLVEMCRWLRRIHSQGSLFDVHGQEDV